MPVNPIKIGGAAMPQLKLSGLTFSKEKIWSKNAGRSSSGKMVGDVVAIKNKLELEWPPLTRKQVAKIDDALTPAFVDVTFLDPGTDKEVTKKMYAGSPSYPVYSYVDGIKTYVGVKVNLIEQ